MDLTEAWSALVEEFRSYGGRAENVIQWEGPLGLGLFPIDPCQPVKWIVSQDSIAIRGDNMKEKSRYTILSRTHYDSSSVDEIKNYQALTSTCS